MRRPRVRAWLGVLGVASVAFAFKRFYSTAGAEALDWLLRPTAALAGLFSGHEFVKEPGSGYLCRELSLLIAPACAGGNFLLVAWLSLIARWPALAPSRRPLWFLATTVAAYATTLLANSLRIALAVAFGHESLRFGLDAAQAHRLLGVVAYLGALLLLQASASWLLQKPAGALLRALPLFAYLFVTLAIPLLRGIPMDTTFRTHALWVLAGTLAAWALAAGLGRAWLSLEQGWVRTIQRSKRVRT